MTSFTPPLGLPFPASRSLLPHQLPMHHYRYVCSHFGLQLGCNYQELGTCGVTSGAV